MILFRASKDYTVGIAVKRATGCMDKAHKKPHVHDMRLFCELKS